MNKMAGESAGRLARTRRMIAAIESRGGIAGSPGRLTPHGLFTFGHAAIDERLEGGLARGRLHEVFAGGPENASTAAGFALMLARRASPDAPILWTRHERAEQRGGMVLGTGLVGLGLDPGQFLFAITPDPVALLRAADDILRCHQVGAIIIEAWGAAPVLNLTSSRRLALAAEKSGVTALLLRVEASPCPSAAQSRWEVTALPSTPLPPNAPGDPSMKIRLQRHRAGLPEQSWRVEWDRDRQCFREPSLPGVMVPLSGGRQAAAMAREGWRRSA